MVRKKSMRTKAVIVDAAMMSLHRGDAVPENIS
jgi:hypothetical protein